MKQAILGETDQAEELLCRIERARPYDINSSNLAI